MLHPENNRDCQQRPIRVLCALLAIWMLMLFTSVSGAAEDSLQSLDEVASEAVLARLSDADLRRLIAERLDSDEEDTAAESDFNPAVAIWQFQRQLGQVRTRLEELLAVRHRIGDEARDAWAALNRSRPSGSLLTFVISMMIAFALGLLAELALNARLKNLKDTLVSLDHLAADNLMVAKIKSLLALFVLRLVSILVLALVAGLVFFVISSSGAQDRVTFFFYLGALLIVRVAAALIAVFYAPAYPVLRLPLYSDAEARGLYRGLVVTVLLTAFAFFTCALFGTLGVRSDAHPLLLMMVGNLFVIAFSITVFRYRASITRDLNSIDDRPSFRGLLAPVWPWALIFIVFFIWVAVVFSALTGGEPLYGAALVTVAVLLFYPTFDVALERGALHAREESNDFAQAVVGISRLAALVVIITFCAVLWRVDFLRLDSGGAGSKVVAIALQIGATLLVAYMVWQFFRIWIDRKIREEDALLAVDGVDPAEMEIGGEGLSRIRTLLPLLKMTLRIALSLIVTMIVLSSLGVDIGPVLAGAGVLGLAIGFGSQTLVRDIVSGGFFLVDDAFRLGEYVDVGAVKGTVEKIQIRSLRLRHHRGAVHTVPFGEIATLTNYSRDWAIMKLKFVVPFDTDVEKVRKILKRVGAELLEHPDVGDDFIQQFKSQGVLEIGEYGLVVRAKFMCKPGRQFLIRRYAFVALQDAFRENNIDFARPQIRVLSASDEDDKIVSGAAGAARNSVVDQPAPA